MVRGIEKRPLFRDDLDRRVFLSQARKNFDRHECRCLTWALMTTHGHIQSRTESGSLSKSMQRLDTSYAMYFNERHDRCGHLFDNRFKSLLVEEEEYLLRLVRYVMLNPIEAGIVRSLDELASYPWTSYPSFVGKRASRLTDVEFTLRLFSDNPERARVDLERWMQAGIDHPDDIGRIIERGPGRPKAIRPDQEAVRKIADRDSRVLGNPAFISDVLSKAANPRADPTRLRAWGWSEARILMATCETLKVSPADVREGRRVRTVSEARAATAWVCSNYLRTSLVDLSSVLAVSPSALSRALPRGRAIANERCTRLLLDIDHLS
jgi:putative transposase